MHSWARVNRCSCTIARRAVVDFRAVSPRAHSSEFYFVRFGVLRKKRPQAAREHHRKYCAHLLQRPGIKINHALLLRRRSRVSARITTI